MRLVFLFLLFSTFPLLSADQEQTCTFCPPSTKGKWKNKMRVRALQNLEGLLNWTLSESLRSYALDEPYMRSIYTMGIPEGKEFIKWYGYFSYYDPLVGRVSKKMGDLDTARCLLKKIYDAIPEQKELRFATEEALAKVMAYRDLKLDDRFSIATRDEEGQKRLATYRVDHVFNLWKGMPAFGLISEDGSAPILLFRGTDFSLDSQRGWASLMSDLDVTGPGLRAFNKAQSEIHAWLKGVALNDSKARVIGFSLGGVLAGYTYLYENEWVSDEGCVAFNPPGVSDQVYQDWSNLPQEKKNAFTVYVNRGDVVSKIGKLFGNAFEISTDNLLTPFRAHAILLTVESGFSSMKIDLDKENQSRLDLIYSKKTTGWKDAELPQKRS